MPLTPCLSICSRGFLSSLTQSWRHKGTSWAGPALPARGTRESPKVPWRATRHAPCKMGKENEEHRRFEVSSPCLAALMDTERPPKTMKVTKKRLRAAVWRRPKSQVPSNQARSAFPMPPPRAPAGAQSRSAPGPCWLSLGIHRKAPETELTFHLPTPKDCRETDKKPTQRTMARLELHGPWLARRVNGPW